MGSADPASVNEENDDPVRLIQRLAVCGYPLVEEVFA